MYRKCIVCFAICIVTCYVKAAKEASSPTDMTCLTYGGNCVRKGDCPKDNLARITGLCPTGPEQKPLECCHGLANSATGCRDQGGECFAESYHCTTLTRADDCAENEKCCILIR
ncbi:jg4772 [Pararge aegeria aegeria]|uniref:Jg4772 protein n=1 Tax=Pararge aegeria aegeria TaxID=348720 RepID=A0A8S4R9E7_9NEOP|nr:jg4772 [Pararge aegeria aegeria]